MEQVLNGILERIEKIHETTIPLLIAIDGRCGSGKTTLGEALAKRLHASLIHMDDFYLRMEQRTEVRFQEPGGNVDYERFFTDVIQPLQRNKDFSYRPFDCRIWDLGTPVTVKATPITVIEGSYACHPSLFKYYDLRIFLTVDKETGRKKQRCFEIAGFLWKNITFPVLNQKTGASLYLIRRIRSRFKGELEYEKIISGMLFWHQWRYDGSRIVGSGSRSEGAEKGT